MEQFITGAVIALISFVLGIFSTTFIEWLKRQTGHKDALLDEVEKWLDELLKLINSLVLPENRNEKQALEVLDQLSKAVKIEAIISYLGISEMEKSMNNFAAVLIKTTELVMNIDKAEDKQFAELVSILFNRTHRFYEALIKARKGFF